MENYQINFLIGKETRYEAVTFNFNETGNSLGVVDLTQPHQRLGADVNVDEIDLGQQSAIG